MARIRVTDRDGATRDVETGAAARPLMEILRDDGFSVLGTCGGVCSCGTCHVYVDAQWVDKLPAKSEDEQMMLEAIGELVEVRDTSRLSCQIEVSEAIDGLAVQVGPVA